MALVVAMRTVFEKQLFERFLDRDSGRTFAGLEFRRCTFQGCALGITLEPALRTTVRDVLIERCEVRGTTLKAVALEDAEVDGLKGFVQTFATVFRHVRLRGKIGKTLLTPEIAPLAASLAQQAAFDAARHTYYKTVDWALDIKDAEFEDCSIRGVPGHLIRRDPETQIVVTREKAEAGDWRSLSLGGTRQWHVALEMFLKMKGQESVVLVAPKRARNFNALLDGLKVLRETGVAEVD